MGCGSAKSNDSKIVSSGKVEIHYFNHQKSDTCFLILQYHRIRFQEHLVTQESWKTLKNSGLSEFGSLPVLEIDDFRLVESRAISRYLAKKFGNYPLNLVDAYWVESLCDFKQDFLNIILSADGPETKCTNSEVIMGNSPFFLSRFEARLKRNNGGNGWFVGDVVSLADFEVFSIVWNYFLRPDLRPKYVMMFKVHAPRVLAFSERFLSTAPHIKSHLSS